MKTKTPPGKWWLLLVIALVVFGGAAAYLLTKLVGQDPKIATQETPEERKAEKPNTDINLPGAAPLKQIPGDYAADDHLWRLVSRSSPLSDPHYRPSELSLIEASRTDKNPDERSVRTDIVAPVNELFAAAKQAGFELIIGSGFRDYELQNLYYTNYVKNYGQEAADSFSAKPGHSEHQTGLTMDLSTADRICYLSECFGETPAGKWLADNGYRYGFILRYPRGKQGVTDFVYEPWHFRYVGKDLARALWQSGLTLDEATPHLLASRS